MVREKEYGYGYGYKYGREVGGGENERMFCWRRGGEVGMLECWNVRREGGCLVWDGMGWDGMGWDGMGWDGMRWSMVDGIYGVDCDGLMA
jgi:hypothetical protein